MAVMFSQKLSTERGSAMIEYALAAVILIGIFVGIAASFNIAIRSRHQAGVVAIDGEAGLLPCDSPLGAGESCY